MDETAQTRGVTTSATYSPRPFPTIVRRAGLLCPPGGRAEQQQQRGPGESPGTQQRGLSGKQRGEASPSVSPTSLPFLGVRGDANSFFEMGESPNKDSVSALC